MKLKEFISVSKEESFAVNVSANVDLEIGSGKKTIAYMESFVDFTRDELAEYGSAEVDSFEQSEDGIIMITLKEPIPGNVAIPGEDIQTAVVTETTSGNVIEMQSQPVEEPKPEVPEALLNKAYKLYEDFLAERDRLNGLKRSGKKMSEDDKNWLQAVYGAIKAYKDLDKTDEDAVKAFIKSYKQ